MKVSKIAHNNFVKLFIIIYNNFILVKNILLKEI